MSMHPKWPEILKEFTGAFEIPETLSCSEWNEKYRFLPDGAPFKCWPWQREILDSVDEPDVGELVLMMASQTIGKSECLMSILTYQLATKVGDYLAVQPTLTMAERWSRTRLLNTIRKTPILHALLPGEGQRTLASSGSKLLFKRLENGSSLGICGLNSASALASASIRGLFIDEVDLGPRELVGVGSPFSQAERRLTSFSDSILCSASSPTIEGESKISENYARSDQRVWLVPCHECGHAFELTFETVVWDKSESGKHKPETARIRCPACRSEFSDAVRRLAVLNGRWSAQNPKERRVRGYKMSAFYALQATRKGYASRLHEMVEEFLRVKNDPLTLQPWRNQVACETFEREILKPVSVDYLLERRSNFFKKDGLPDPATHPLPADVLVLTAGVDCQINRIESLVCAWTRGRSCYFIDHRVWPGNTTTPEPWTALGAYLDQSWAAPGWKEEGKRLAPAICFIDAGYLSLIIYAFCNRRSRTFPTKGVGSAMMPLVEMAPGKRGAGLRIVHTDAVKQVFYEKLAIHERDRDGYIHLGDSLSEEFLRQLVSETATKDARTGQLRFKLTKDVSNEALDLAVLNVAGEYALRASYDSLEAARRGLDKLPEEEMKQHALSPRPQRRTRPRPPSPWGAGGITSI
jgi:phage terminase large subunit GpA-like protein